MKKVLIIIICCLFIVGCSQKETPKNEKEEEKNIEITEEKEEYIDDNAMPIAFYYDTDYYQLILSKNYSTNFKVGTDIGLFQIFPSTEKKISYQGKFGEFFYKTWNKIDENKEYKMGFNLKYELNDGTKISHYVYDPSTSMTYKPYVKIYLYDDYAHRNDSWYSHIEKNEFNDNTYLTSIKLTPGKEIDKVSSDIVLTVFTYNGEDDFLEDGEYRGISKYSITINNKK